jgi:hypothetical protein
VKATEQEALKAAVVSALNQPPTRDDPQFVTARGGQVGTPALAYTPGGAPAFWLVPLLAEGLVCGLAQVNLTGRMIRVGILGGSPEDRAGWIEPSFFEAPPPEVMAEIRDAYGEAAIGVPVLSYDANPTRWAWRLEISKGGQPGAVVFITPGGWYERLEDTLWPDREG